MVSYNDVFLRLQDYMLDENFIQKMSKSTDFCEEAILQKKTEKEKEKETHIKEKPAFFIPRQTDTLFWCYYIIKNGEVEYEMLANKNFLSAKQMKIDLVYKIREKKDVVKSYKFDTLTNIENNLANETNMNIKTFLSLCAIENINVFYIRKKTYYEFIGNDTNTIYIIKEMVSSDSNKKHYNKTQNLKYGFETATKDKVAQIKETHFPVDSVNRPIKSITNYKVQELYDICNKFSIEIISKTTNKNKSKQELYDEIVSYF